MRPRVAGFRTGRPDNAQILEVGVGIHQGLGLAYKACEIAPLDIHLDHGKACSVLMVDTYRTVLRGECRERGDWPDRAVGCGHQQACQAFR